MKEPNILQRIVISLRKSAMILSDCIVTSYIISNNQLADILL